MPDKEKNKKAACCGSTPKKIIISLISLLVVGAVVLYLNLGSIVKTVAEKVGSETLGVAVNIGSIDISAKHKSVVVKGISIANPEGYSKPHAMTIGMVNIAMDSFSKELLVFNDVSVKDSELFLEVGSNGTNLSALQDNLKKDKAPSAPKEPSGKEPPKVILKHFLLSGAELHPTVTLVGGELSSVKVPDIKLTGIGVKKNGILAREAIAQIWEAVSSAAIEASAGAGFLQGLSPDIMKDMGVPTGLLDEAGKVLEDATGDISKGIRGLFGD
jgi:hypothetical protein